MPEVALAAGFSAAAGSSLAGSGVAAGAPGGAASTWQLEVWHVTPSGLMLGNAKAAEANSITAKSARDTTKIFLTVNNLLYFIMITEELIPSSPPFVKEYAGSTMLMRCYSKIGIFKLPNGGGQFKDIEKTRELVSSVAPCLAGFLLVMLIFKF